MDKEGHKDIMAAYCSDRYIENTDKQFKILY